MLHNSESIRFSEGHIDLLPDKARESAVDGSIPIAMLSSLANSPEMAVFLEHVIQQEMYNLWTILTVYYNPENLADEQYMQESREMNLETAANLARLVAFAKKHGMHISALRLRLAANQDPQALAEKFLADVQSRYSK